jgi:hypothetical protein
MPWSVANYNTNPALNTAINGIDIAELASASGYNDALRQIMADIRAWTVTYGITTPVSIANGGTGATTAPTALTALGALDAAYRDLPRVDKVNNFTFSNAERANAIWCNGSSIVGTIDPNGTTPINSGAAYALMNGGSSAVTIVPGVGVSLYVNGSTTSASATLAPGAVTTVIKWGTNYWTLAGVGVS